MNLAEMRRDRSSEKLFTYGTERADRLVLRDQDALNAVLGEGRLALPPRWNCMNALFVLPQSADVFDADELREARRNPAIRHFEGPDDNKPWHYFGDAAAREAYDSHRRETPWPRYRRTGMTPVNIAASLSRRLGRKPRFTPAPLRAPR
jgi:lipopolysaccharide biosynthesis glycosyltransferase